MAQPTIKDVAKLAGVSISTVSRVMNKSKPVSPEAERKVLDAINKLGFKPNELARSLVMKKSNSIGILVKDIGIHYMAEMIRGAEEIGRMYKYDIILTSTYGELELEKKAIDFLFRKQVEGVIILSENIDPETIVKLKEYRLPYVLLDRYYKSSDYLTVAVNNKESMKELTNYLIGEGYKKILYLSSGGSFDVCKDKQAGYEEAMLSAGLEVIREEAKGETIDSGYEAGDFIREVFQKNPFDAVICENDNLAIGLMNNCYDNDIRIPESFGLAGFGGSPFASIVRPRLTTVIEPYYDIGAVAMRALTKSLMNNEKMDRSLFLPIQIFPGESTARVK